MDALQRTIPGPQRSKSAHAMLFGGRSLGGGEGAPAEHSELAPDVEAASASNSSARPRMNLAQSRAKRNRPITDLRRGIFHHPLRRFSAVPCGSRYDSRPQQPRRARNTPVPARHPGRSFAASSACMGGPAADANAGITLRGASVAWRGAVGLGVPLLDGVHARQISSSNFSQSTRSTGNPSPYL